MLSEYYNNKAYENLTAKQRKAILDWFNHHQRSIDRLLRQIYHNNNKAHERLLRDWEEQLRGAQYMLKTSFGAVVAFNWPGYKDEWFFPSNEDVEDYIAWLDQCKE